MDIPVIGDNTQVSVPKQLYPGWNAIGFSGTPATATSAFSSLSDKWLHSFGWDASKQQYEPPVFNGDQSSSTLLTQGKGYWIYLSAPAEYSLPVFDKTYGLLVWYDFDDDFTRVGYVLDKSGNNRNATIIGNVGTTTDISEGKSIRFSGMGYIQAPDNPAGLRNNVSFSFWFRTNNPDSNYKMASAAQWLGGPGSGWTMATHVPEFWSDDGQGVLVPAQPNNANNFIPNEWNYEVVTYDGLKIREYTNGNLINSWESRGVPIGVGVPMAIGGWPQFSGYNFVGDIDDFRIYDYALVPDEISAFYATGLY